MNNATDIYQELEIQVKRLSDKDNLLSLEDILKDYVIPEVTVKQQIELTRILEQKKPESLQKILDNIRAIREAIKILALMEASDNVQQFKELADKKNKRAQKEKPYELTDFDKFLKAVASVPKKDLKKHTRK